MISANMFQTREKCRRLNHVPISTSFGGGGGGERKAFRNGTNTDAFFVCFCFNASGRLRTFNRRTRSSTCNSGSEMVAFPDSFVFVDSRDRLLQLTLLKGLQGESQETSVILLQDITAPYVRRWNGAGRT